MKRFFLSYLVIAAFVVSAALVSCKGNKDTTFELSATAQSLEFIPAGESKTFNVVSNVDWTISGQTSASWLTVSPASGKGNAAVSVTAEANMVGGNRSVELIITANGTPTVKVNVSQAAMPVITEVPEEIIPEEISEKFREIMPVYSGSTPSDISGEYLVSPNRLKAGSMSYDRPGDTYNDLYLSFIKDENGKFSYRERQGTGQGESDDVTVVGTGNNFTAYFIWTGTSDEIWSKMSVLISGTIIPEGISNFHYAFIMLEKADDPSDRLVPVNTYRIFINGGNGVAVRRNWISTSVVKSFDDLHSVGEGKCAACQTETE